MTNICSVVVIRLSKRQVDEVVQQEKNAESHNDQRRHQVLILNSDVVTESVPVPQREHKVKLTHEIGLEFVFELAELFGLSKHQQSTSSEDQTRCENSRNRTQNVRTVIFISILEMNANTESNVESIEHHQSQQSFFNEVFRERREFLRDRTYQMTDSKQHSRCGDLNKNY